MIEHFGPDYFAANYRDYARQNPPRKLAFYAGLARRAAGANPSPRVLEIGCAFGAFRRALDPAWRWTGTDLSRYALAHLRRAHPGAHCFAASAHALPVAVPFDLVAAFDVIEHVPDLERVACEVTRCLRPGGAFLFVVPVYDGPTGPIIRLLDKDPTHVHKRSRDFWLRWAAASFTIHDWCGIYRYLLPGGYYVHLPTHRLRRCTPAIAVLAARP